MSLSNRSLWSRLGFNDGNKPSHRVPAFKQASDLFDFLGIECTLNDRRDEMQRLAILRVTITSAILSNN
jgi:hypothetical protein